METVRVIEVVLMAYIYTFGYIAILCGLFFVIFLSCLFSFVKDNCTLLPFYVFCFLCLWISLRS